MKTASDASTSQQTLSYSVPREPSLKAETIWLLYMYHNHPIYRSCDGLPGVFQAIFPDSQIAANLSIILKKNHAFLITLMSEIGY